MTTVPPEAPPAQPAIRVFLATIRHLLIREVPDHFPWLTPPAVFFEIAAGLCVVYSIALPVTGYIYARTIFLSDLTIYYLLGALAFYFTGRMLRSSRSDE
jgi:hypothetical protein